MNGDDATRTPRRSTRSTVRPSRVRRAIHEIETSCVDRVDARCRWRETGDAREGCALPSARP